MMLRYQNTILLSALATTLLFGCSTQSHIGGDDAGGGEACGPTSCGVGEVCCQASCGICAASRESCPTLYCDPPPDDGGVGEPCGPTTCGAGEVCCNASCGICTPPGGDCLAIACADAGPPPGAICGLVIPAGVMCAPGEFCDYPGGCGLDDRTGVCAPTSGECAEDCPGVCGCDGRDYCNACIAAASGVDVQHDGSCGGTTTPCDPWDATGDGFCDLFLGYSWDGAACVGISGCSCVGTDCGLVGAIEACGAAHAGCGSPPPPTVTCGGFGGDATCAADEYCDYADGSFCGGDDSLGVCRPRPGPGCIEVYSPVCGCDGVTYDNSCFANAAGQDFFASGSCGE